jgi:hypothetical protein
MKPLDLTIPFPSETFLDDIVVTALEGGIGYWSTCFWYKPSTATAAIAELETEEELLIDRNVVETGIRRIVAAAPPYFQPNGIEKTQCADVPFLWEYVRSNVVQAILSDDCGEIDADIADCIVQVGLFNEVRYG